MALVYREDLKATVIDVGAAHRNIVLDMARMGVAAAAHGLFSTAAKVT